MRKLLTLFLLIVFILPLKSQMVSSFMRVDADPTGFYLWFGGASKAGNLTLAHEVIYFPNSNYFEAEIGPSFALAEGKLTVCPMFGPYLNLTSGKVDYWMPQLYLYSTVGKYNFEGWNIFSLGASDATKDQTLCYGRYFITWALASWFGLGPHVEYTLDLSKGAEETTTSLQYGAAMSLPYGTNNRLLTFIGIESKDDNRFLTRVTFLRNF
jgi:hypothetical protein